MFASINDPFEINALNKTKDKVMILVDICNRRLKKGKELIKIESIKKILELDEVLFKEAAAECRTGLPFHAMNKELDAFFKEMLE